ncbi:AAA-like domain-containing protein [Anabaena lutea]|uniref:AAA-like domain-containing protein n=1 Tax=Anabaena lutea FACHB-196 TaxID=2692881 RepID=A0ABR8FBV7_9NOST|nr:AAA-like domain-containing protein [Anabaena lutea]MBD2567409.1 AAA-like domain-containing protein [Anabaena lutea FACHB-196]
MLTYSSPNQSYQVGGSLPVNASTYVRREADKMLFEGLLSGEFCYVFNARQMGKSSLRVQTTHRLQAEGIQCGVIDITAIGTKEVTPEQWYASMIGLLVKTFKLNISLLNWWKERSHLSYVNRLSDFIDTVLLAQVSAPIVIFIDEIDSVLSLKFSTDDFFALIRACYNRRAEQPEYQRLTFALFGVATPADLISDTTRTPFNVGKAIELQGFQLTEATPLLTGLTGVVPDSQSTLERILYWTGGQPFLTQKLCKIISSQLSMVSGKTGVDHLVEINVLHNWESQDEPEHLKTIRDRLLYSEQRIGRLLGIYQQILLPSPLDTESENLENLSPNLSPSRREALNFPPSSNKSFSASLSRGGKKVGGLGKNYGITSDDSPEQTELILTGLVEKKAGLLQVKNPIYQQIFNLDWVSKQLANLRPYSQAINAWIASGYIDESWLLRGQALQEVLRWTQGKSLSDLDYRFLAVSQELERQEVEKKLEAERLQEVEARLEIERKRSIEQLRNLRRQRVMLGIVSVMMLVAIALGLVAYNQYQQTAISEVRAIALSSEALYASNKAFDALLQAIKGKERLQHLNSADANLQAQVNSALQKVVLTIQEYNHFTGHKAAVLAVHISPDGQQIATAGVDKTIKLWKPDGTLIKTLSGHQSIVRVVKFSPDGKMIASAGDDTTIKLWKRDGTLLKTIPTNSAGIWTMDFSPDSSTIISGGVNTLQIWSREGKLLHKIPSETTGIRDITFSPDGQTIAAACADNRIKLWNRDGTLKMILEGHNAPVQSLAFSPDGKLLISGSADANINIWNREGKILQTIPSGHDAGIYQLAVSPDGKTFASGSWDKTIKLWNRDGSLITTLRGHNATIWDMAFSPDGSYIASAGAENIIRLWKTQNIYQKTLYAFIGTVRTVAFNPQGTMLAVTGTEKTIKFFNTDGIRLRTIKTLTTDVSDLDWHPTGKLLVSAGEDKVIRLWQPDGTLVKSLEGHQATVLSVSWNPKNNTLASSGIDGNIFLWQADGKLLKTWKAHDVAIWSIQFSPDGKTLASASNDGTVRLWNTEGKLLHTLKGHDSAVWRVAFSPDGQRIASGSGDTTIKLWTRDGKLLKTLTGHTAAVWGIAFSPNGKLIATSSIDETVKIWNQDGTLITTLNGHNSGVRTVAFHPRLPMIASGSDDQTVVLWNLEQILNLDFVKSGCDWVRDYLQTNATVMKEDSQLCRDILSGLTQNSTKVAVIHELPLRKNKVFSQILRKFYLGFFFSHAESQREIKHLNM